MVDSSGVGLVLGLAVFLISFSPSLLPRRWLAQGLIGGVGAALGYLVGYLLQMTVEAVMRLMGIEVEVSWRVPSGSTVVLAGIGVILLTLGWWASVRQHRTTARLVGMAAPPVWQDVAATGLAIMIMIVISVIVDALTSFTAWLTRGFDLFLPSLLSLVVAICVAVLVLRMVNRLVVHQALVAVSRQADKLDRRRPQGLQAPVSSTHSGSADAAQSWTELGRRGQIFTACGPTAEQIASVLQRPAIDPIRIYASLGGGGITEAVATAMAEVVRTGALERSTVVVTTPAGRGWVDEYSVQAVEYLTAGDCATVAVQYSRLASAFVYLADRESPRACARAVLLALERAIADLPTDRRPKVYVSGESLGAYGGHGAFADADDMLDRVAGAVWIGTPGFTEIPRALTRSRTRGSPEITPVIDNGRHIRFVTQPTELVADAYGRPLGQWEFPRVVYVQHASDPMSRFTGELAYREPDWMRERAGADVNPSLRWWPLITWFQVSTDMITSLDTPAGHGHIYEDELIPIWAAVLHRTDAPLDAITAAVGQSLQALRAPLPTAAVTSST